MDVYSLETGKSTAKQLASDGTFMMLIIVEGGREIRRGQVD